MEPLLTAPVMGFDGWFDSHCHLDLPPLSDDWAEVGSRARAAGVTRYLIPGVLGVVQPVDLPPGVLRAWGIHPHTCGLIKPENLKGMCLASSYKPVAIGECGLDVEADVPFEQQVAIFEGQLDLARHLGVPVLVHLRGRWEEALSLCRESCACHTNLGGNRIPWIMHSFSGSLEIARRFLAVGAYISFSGTLCRPNARKAPQIAREVPLDRVLFETDAPDLPPHGWDRVDNEPAALPMVAARFAELRGLPLEQVRRQSNENAARLFPELRPD